MWEFIELLERDAGLKSDPLFDRIIAKERDLEFLLGELEEWKSKSYYCRQLPWPDPTGNAPYQYPTEVEQEISRLTLRASAIYQTVQQFVFKNYRFINSAELPRFFLPLFEAAFQLLQPLSKPLVVFTTNYDPAIEDLCERESDGYDCIDGFFHDAASKSYVWRRNEFDHYAGPKSKKNIVLFKVHGSTTWIKTSKEIIRTAPIYKEDDPAHRNVLIYPAKKKVAVEEPFFTAYDYFQRCMEGCRLCLTIGYSFRDEDALSRLRSAASINPNLKVIVLDPNSAEICSKKLRPLGIQAEPIGRRFEDMAGDGDANLRSQIRDDIAAAVASTS